jgi:signal peptide peptidase SppA
MGGTTYKFIEDAFKTAIIDREVEAIVLDIDSPGGTVSGVDNVSELIFNSRGEKPIVAFANGQMTSAAYYIGSAADILVGEKSADVGSIGVIMIHEDYSKWEEMRGIKTTYLSAGKYKALGNDSEPLSDTARKVFQDELDYLYTIFVEAIAKNRDVEVDQVLSKMADGRIFIGQQAVDAGLIDRVGNLQLATDLAKARISDSTFNQQRSKSMNDKLKIETVAQLAATHPDLIEEIREDYFDKGVQSVDVGVAKQAARDEERDRILGLVSAKFGEDEGDNFKTLVETGVTVEQFKAISKSAPEKKPEKDAQAEMLDEITKAGADNPGPDDGSSDSGDFMAAAQAYKQQMSCSLVDAMKHIRKTKPDLHAAYIKSVN